VDQALEGKPVRLVRVERESPGEGLALSDVVAATDTGAGLVELSPVAVFSALYARQYGNEPPAELLRAFHSLVDDDARRSRAGHGEVV
jgi:exonuclease SbcD